MMKSRSGDLLRNLLLSGDIAPAEIRAELRLAEDEFDLLVAGTQVMSLSHQLCFATFLIERVPRLARRGQTLRNQAVAAIAFRDGETTVHSSHPLKWNRLKGR